MNPQEEQQWWYENLPGEPEEKAPTAEAGCNGVPDGTADAPAPAPVGCNCGRPGSGSAGPPDAHSTDQK